MNSVLILDSVCSKRGVINKDVNGGLGTRTYIGKSLRAKALERVKKSGVVLPLLEFAVIAAILKKHNYKAFYIQVSDSQQVTKVMQFVKNKNISTLIFYPALVAHTNDFDIADQLKFKLPSVQMGAVGPFVSQFPGISLEHFDWVIKGEPEEILLNKPLDELDGLVESKGFIENLDELPLPDWTIFQGSVDFSYRPMLQKRPFYTMQGSRGCPMSCSYYCPYPASQGIKWRTRSVASLIEELQYLIQEYGAKSILFRDAYFSLKKERTIELAENMIAAGIALEWACETRLDSLDEGGIDILYQAGLRSINIGIESEDEEILKASKRKGMEKKQQRCLIQYCYDKGIKINAFFILGLMEDTRESILKTIKYAKTLPLYSAQFTVNTPLPGTGDYQEMRSKLINHDLESLDNNTLVFKHPHLTVEDIAELKERAFVDFYFNPTFISRQILWRIRELFS